MIERIICVTTPNGEDVRLNVNDIISVRTSLDGGSMIRTGQVKMKDVFCIEDPSVVFEMMRECA